MGNRLPGWGATPPCPLQPQADLAEREGREQGRAWGSRCVGGSSLWHTGQKQGPGEGWGQRAGGHGFFWQCVEPSWGRETPLPLPDSCVIPPADKAAHCPRWGAPTEPARPNPLAWPRRPESHPVPLVVTGRPCPVRPGWRKQRLARKEDQG